MEITEIQVYKVPNGHVLKVNSDEYMYYSLAALLEGFMYHVGLEELAAVDAETMREFIAASVVWRDNKDAVKEIVRLQKENNSLSSMVKNLKAQVKRLNERLKGEDSEE